MLQSINDTYIVIVYLLLKGYPLNQTIITLKQRIDQNYKKIKRKYILAKPILKMINNLIDTKASNQVVNKWLEEYEMSIYCLNHHLDLIEQKSSYAR